MDDIDTDLPDPSSPQPFLVHRVKVRIVSYCVEGLKILWCPLLDVGVPS